MNYHLFTVLNFQCTDDVRSITDCNGYFNRVLDDSYIYLNISDIEKLTKLLENPDSKTKVYLLTQKEFKDKNLDHEALIKNVNIF